MNPKVLIAMSGGVDSSVAATLLKEQGFECTGAMMKLFDGNASETGRKTCCSLEDAADARSVAHRLDIPFYVFNFKKTFAEQVIERFARAYMEGATPNPCIDCNRYLKFERFLRRADELEIGRVATGHYARIEYDAGGKRYLLKKGADPDKDQSYVLYAMTQAQLARTLFPLGGLRKAEVREIAREQGLVNAAKRESQDICFVPDGDYARFIEEYIGKQPTPGLFLDSDGNAFGQHRGVVHFTVGQRKGLGLSAPAPLYVRAIDPKNNTVTVCGEKELYTKTLLVRDINLILTDRLAAPVRAGVKIRYRQSEQPATVTQVDEGILRVDFDSPQRAIAKGQAAVFYDGGLLIGGGTIC
jgi:tRNA-specific 2-thiouridylase